MPPLVFDPFPAMTTRRLNLRALAADDAPQLHALRSHPLVNRYVERKKDTGLPGAVSFISRIRSGIAANQWMYWAISLKENPSLIGTICLWNFDNHNTIAEVGYELHPDFQHQGLMNEALGAVLEYAFGTLGLTSIKAYTHEQNEKSSNLLARHGFVRTNDKDPLNNQYLIYQRNDDAI